MKTIRYTAFLSLFLLIACSPSFKYLGDSYEPNIGDIDVYYDIGDISKDFKVMGILTANTEESMDISNLNDSSDKVKESMIKKAATKGADAILFINIYGTGNDGAIVESKLIKYK